MNLFETLGGILKPTDPSNPFGIDYSVYVECEILSVYSRSVKVRELDTDRIAYVDVNHILYSAMGIGDIIKADKNFLTFLPATP